MRAEEIVDLVVKFAKAHGATDAVSQVKETDWSMIRFSNNGITVSKVLRETSVGVFLFVKEKRAGSVISNISKNAIERAVADAARMARTSPPGGTYAPLPKGRFKYDKRLIKVGKVSAKEGKLPTVVKDAIDSARQAGANRVAGSLVAETTRLTQRSSGGAKGQFKCTTFNLNVRAFADGESTGQFATVVNDVNDLDGREIGRIAGDVARSSLRPEPAQPGAFDVVLGPMTAADLMEEVVGASSAFYVDAGMSFFTDRLNQEMASGRLNLTDDPTDPSSPGAAPFDDEGIPTRTNKIIDSGRLTTYLHNSTTAAKMNVKTTANAGLVIPKPFSVRIDAGTKSIEDLISEVDDGLFITNNWYLRYQNMRAGDFSTILRDGLFRVKGGEISGPVRGLRMTDNLLRILKGIEDIGSKRYWIKWWEVETPVLAPAMLVRGVRFTKPTI